MFFSSFVIYRRMRRYKFAIVMKKNDGYEICLIRLRSFLLRAYSPPGFFIAFSFCTKTSPLFLEIFFMRVFQDEVCPDYFFFFCRNYYLEKMLMKVHFVKYFRIYLLISTEPYRLCILINNRIGWCYMIIYITCYLYLNNIFRKSLILSFLLVWIKLIYTFS